MDWVQFKWRNHDPQIGRFIEIDPLSEKYEYNSTYAFSENKVVAHVELEGLEAIFFEHQLEQKGVKAGLTREEYIDLRQKEGKGTLLVLTLLVPGPEEVFLASVLGFGVKTYKAADAVVDIKKGIDKTVDVEKTVDKATDLQKAEERAAKLSEKQRPGEDFTKAGKDAVKDVNKAKNNGQTVCENCGVKTTPAQQSKKGVTPSKTETHVDHVKRKSEGGSGTPDNGQVLCRGCNLDKH